MWYDHTVLSAARLGSALLGALVFLAALRAYAKTQRRSLLALATGAGVLTIGYVLAGTLVEVAGWSIAEATMVESIFTLIAVALLVASLYLRDRRPIRTSRPPAEAEVAHG